MDPSCAAALLAVARPALPPGLTDRLLRWDDLSDAERAVARGDLEALASIMGNAKRGTVPGWERSLGLAGKGRPMKGIT